MRAWYTVLSLFALSVLLAGCDTDQDDQVQMPDPWVEVYAVPGQLPLAGIKVVVMDPATNLPVLAPALTDANGQAVFPDLPPGDYRLLAFGGAAYGIVSLPSCWQQTIQAGVSVQAGLTGPFAKTSLLPLPPQIIMGRYAQAGGLPRIAGMVLDAVTGAPLDQVFLSQAPGLTGYTGLTNYTDDVTGADGNFTVSEITFAKDPLSGNMFQISPLLVTRHGYRPRLWKYNVPHGDDNLDIQDVRLELEPLSAAVDGVLLGRMLLGGEPAVGVVVGLSGGQEYVPAKAGPGLSGQVAVTNAVGEFRFEGLPSGSYFVQGGFLPRDGFHHQRPSGDHPWEVSQGEQTDTADHVLYHEINLQYPPNGWEYFGPQWVPDLQWEAVVGVAYYEVYLNRGFLGQTTDNTLVVPEDWGLNVGPQVWRVDARNDKDEWLGTNEVGGLFYIIEPAE